MADGNQDDSEKAPRWVAELAAAIKGSRRERPQWLDLAISLMMAIMTVVMLGGVPWAFRIEAGLATVKTAIGLMEIPPKEVRQQLDDHEVRLDKLERQVWGRHGSTLE